MKRFVVAVLTGVSFVALGTAPALAQDPANADPPARQVEVTPYVSLGSFGSSRIGAAIEFPLTSKTSIEAEVGYRQDEIHALSASVNLLYYTPRIGRVMPYVVGGAGLAQYGTFFFAPGSQTPVTLSQVTVTVNAGGGIKVPVTNNWGLRTDARWTNGFGRSAGENWRVYNGISLGTGKR